jgi:hypothetical protein
MFRVMFIIDVYAEHKVAILCLREFPQSTTMLIVMLKVMFRVVLTQSTKMLNLPGQLLRPVRCKERKNNSDNDDNNDNKNKNKNNSDNDDNKNNKNKEHQQQEEQEEQQRQREE